MSFNSLPTQMADFGWLGNVRPEVPFFEAYEKGIIQYFKQKKQEFGLLHKFVSRKEDEYGFVVLTVFNDVYHMHYFRLLAVLEAAIQRFTTPALMPEILSNVLKYQKTRCYSVKDLEQIYNKANKSIKKLGTLQVDKSANVRVQYDLQMFESDGKKIFPKKTVKAYQVRGLLKLVDSMIEGKDKNTGKLADRGESCLSFARALFTVKDAENKACNMIVLQKLHYDDTKKHLGTMQKKAEILRVSSDPSLSELYLSAKEHKSEVDFIYKRMPIKRDITWRDVEEEFKKANLDTSSFNNDKDKLILYNVAIIKQAEDNGKLVPQQVKIGDATAEAAIKKLRDVAERLETPLETLIAPKVVKYKKPQRNEVSFKKYLDEDSGVVACYKNSTKQAERSVDNLVMVHWIDKKHVMDTILLEPQAIINQFLEFEDFCKDFVGGIQLDKIEKKEKREINKKILETLKSKLCKMRNTATVVHHVAKHGDCKPPMRSMTGDEMHKAAQAYFEKVRSTARRRKLVNTAGHFTLSGNYSFSLVNMFENDPNFFKEMYFSVSQEGKLFLTTAHTYPKY